MAIPRKELFATLAVNSFDQAFRAIFSQTDEEVQRLQRINAAMRILETTLLDPARMEQMDTTQRIALLDLLSRNQQTAIRNVTSFGSILTRVRNIVATHDGLQRNNFLTLGEDGEAREVRLLTQDDEEFYEDD